MLSIKSKLKSFIKNNDTIVPIALSIYNRFLLNNSLKNRGGEVNLAARCMVKRSRILSKGKNNIVTVSEGCCLTKCSVKFYGSNNTVIFDKCVRANNLEIHIEDDGNIIYIGSNTTFENNVHLVCIEGTQIRIGTDCMFSSNISVVTGDSHSVLDLNGIRINPSKSIQIGNHVWVGNTVRITKGVIIENDSVIGVGSIVTRRFCETNIAIAGNPAMVIKKGISWDRTRLPTSEGERSTYIE